MPVVHDRLVHDWCHARSAVGSQAKRQPWGCPASLVLKHLQVSGVGLGGWFLLLWGLLYRGDGHGL